MVDRAVRLGFWNMLGNDAAVPLLIDLVAEHQIDIVLIAEQPQGYSDADLAALLSTGGSVFEAPHRPPTSRILALSRLGQRLQARHFDALFPNATFYWIDRRITLVAAHLVSKSHATDHDQAEEAKRFSAMIRDYETRRAGDDLTIVMGDLNMDPFEEGMVTAKGLNAIAFRGRRAATVKRVEYPYFYNPMWSLCGDRTAGPPGTYHFNNSGHHINRYWHMYDQVLVRPSLADSLVDLSVVESIGEVSLLKLSGWPEASISDHLPLIATFEI